MTEGKVAIMDQPLSVLRRLRIQLADVRGAVLGQAIELDSLADAAAGDVLQGVATARTVYGLRAAARRLRAIADAPDDPGKETP